MVYIKYISLCIVLIICLIGYSLIPKLDITISDGYHIWDQHGRLMYHAMGDNNRSMRYTNLNQIPSFLIDIILYREDRRFWQHYGIDTRAIGRTLYQRYQEGSLTQGASTIDQQLVKLLLRHHQRTWRHKIQEIGYAIQINWYYTKSDILLAYINNLEFGFFTQGFALACLQFYQTDCHNLTQNQLIYLFSQSKFPGRRMVDDYASGFAQRLSYDLPHVYQIDVSVDWKQAAGKYQMPPQKYPHLTTYILDRTTKHNDVIVNIQSGHIYTSLDLDLIDRVQDIIVQYRPYLQSQGSQDACVVIMQGNMLRSLNIARSRNDSAGGMVNPCIRPRQVGSALKPFVYALAMYDFKFTGSTTIQDEPLTFVLQDGSRYEPKNFDLLYHGEVTLAQALGSSLNTPAVKLLAQLGLDRFWTWIKLVTQTVQTDASFTQNPLTYGLSLALGSIEISPLDFVRMYQIFHHAYPSLSKYGHVLQEVKTILSDNDHRLISFPLHNRFDMPDTRVKSGTSRHFVDGWACGGVQEYTMCIRVGNYNAKPMRESGYNTAGVLWHEIGKMLLNFDLKS